MSRCYNARDKIDNSMQAYHFAASTLRWNQLFRTAVFCHSYWLTLATSPRSMLATPSSQPLITWPNPILKVKGFCPSSFVLQKGTLRSPFLPYPNHLKSTACKFRSIGRQSRSRKAAPQFEKRVYKKDKGEDDLGTSAVDSHASPLDGSLPGWASLKNNFLEAHILQEDVD